jgi:hypothetical protein
MAEQYPPPPPPPPPPPGQWQPAGGYYQAVPQLGTGLQVTCIVAGIFGILFGLIPLLFGLAWAFGLVAIVVGVMAYRRAARVGQHQGRAGIIMGLIALALGVAGAVIVGDAFDDVDNSLSCLDEADTPAEIGTCSERD